VKIVFNLCGVGTGDNGGSKTLIESANTLHDIGQEVVIVDSSSSKYTWGEIKVEYIKVKDINSVSGDVIIATGIGSLSTTNNSKIKNKYHWIRGHETWNMSEKDLMNKIKESSTKKLVNSICLQSKLKQFGIKSEIIRPGHDFNKIYPIPSKIYKTRVTLGGLYNEGLKRSSKRTNWIFDSFNILRKKYEDSLELWMFGTESRPKYYDSCYSQNPNDEMKNYIYNNIDIWLSPSELEGLHIPPAEAMLAEKTVVGTTAHMSGTQDYLIDHETGLVSNNSFNSFLVDIEILINNEVLRKELGKKGREKILSLGDRKENMTKLVKLFEKEI
jgi:glycosyltransferase involved in cell wall biosynthesis